MSLCPSVNTLHEDVCTFMIILRQIFLRMRNVSDKSCRENQNTQVMFSNFVLNLAVCEVMWKNIIEPDRPQITKWHVHGRLQTHT